MQTNPHHKAPAPPPPHHKAPAPKRPPLQRRTRLLLIVAGAIAGVLVLALIAVNLLVSADWVRDRVAQRIKEQTGRVLQVNGSTALLFTPGPRVIITDATFTDPDAQAGTADFSVGRLVLDLSLMELLSRQVDADRVVLVKPVLTIRLGSEDRRADAVEKPKQRGVAKAANSGDKPRRDVRLRDVRIKDGTVNILYDENGTEKRIEHITAKLSLPTLTDPFTGAGKFDWKAQTVDFNFTLTSLADLREKRPAKLVLALDMPAIAARFDGSILTRPSFTGEGELSAKAHSIPSLLAWMRERPPVATAIGDGEIVSHLAWKNGELTLSGTRFALEHARGQGQAVVTLRSPRPHIRAALALDSLDLNPFLSGSPTQAADTSGKPPAAQAVPGPQPQPGLSEATPPPSGAASPKDWFSKPDAEQSESATEPAPDAAPPASTDETAQSAPTETAPIPPTASAPAAEPASFDADVNLNVRKTRVAHLDLGPSSLGLAFRDGVLNATLGGMELYDGHATGKLVLDVTKPVPAFTGDFRLEGVQAKSLLSDAAQISLLEGHTKLALQIGGAGASAEAIKSSLQGQGSIAVSDGAIEGIDLTELISAVGAGQMPNLRQGPGAKTAFSDLGGSFTIANGIVETSNLKMTSPLAKATAAGTVNLPQGTIDMLANPEITEGQEGKNGANALAGLSVPVRIEGPLDRPTIRPEIKGMFADPEKAGKTVKQIGDALQKKFKGKPVGEAIGRFLGNVQIGPRGDGEQGDAGPQGNGQRSGKKANPQAKPAPNAGATEQGDSENSGDPELDRILR